MILVKVGAFAPLSLQLESLHTDRYVQAYVVDRTGLPVAGSPFTLTHSANGLYLDPSSLVMPDKILIATYIVYTDPGFSVLDEENLPSVDVFSFQEIELRLITDVEGEIFASGNVEGEVYDGEILTGETLPDESPIDGELLTGETQDGQVIEGQTIDGEIDQ